MRNEMNEHQNLYSVTGNILDVNTLLVPRDELRRLVKVNTALLEVLKGLLSVTDGQAIYNFMEPQRKIARDAIAKATGETE